MLNGSIDVMVTGNDHNSVEAYTEAIKEVLQKDRRLLVLLRLTVKDYITGNTDKIDRSLTEDLFEVVSPG